MKLIKFILSSLLFFGIGFPKLMGQEAIPASSGNASGNGGIVSYSVGQAVYTTIRGAGGSATQGFQQTYEISVISGIENAKDISLSFVVYPNPAIDYLTLSITGDVQLPLIASLYNLYGKLISTQ